MDTPLKRCFWLILFSLLTACTPATPSPTPVPTLDMVDVYAQTLGTAVSRMTQTAAAPTATPTLLPGQSPFFSLKGYVAVYAQGGSLYSQSDENAPVLLAPAQGSALPFERMLSDDRQRIIFLRGKTSKSSTAYADVYTVNADGSRLQLLIPPEWLASLSKGTGRGAALPVFVPGTRNVLFETSLCQSPAKDARCTVGIFLADDYTGQIRPVLPPGSQARFTVSPDGSRIAAAFVGHVNILDLDGKLVHENILEYTSSTPDALFASIYWLPDSSGLIAALPTNTFHISAYNKDVPAYAFWRYTFADAYARLIPLDPAPMNLQGEADRFVISPDGKWLLYGGNGPSNSDVYLANLLDGRVQRVADNPEPAFSWSPDSLRFFGQNFAGVIGERVAQVTKKNFDIIRWIDATHFLCRFCGEDDAKPFVAEITGDTLTTYRLPLVMNDDAYLLIVPK